jgi:phosphoglycolate phosphatase
MKAGETPMERARTRPWNAYDAYLIDIDGTLLHCQDAVHYYAFRDALQFLSGRPLDLSGVNAHGNTDVGILRDALTAAGIPREVWFPRLAEACDRMCRYVAARRAELCPRVLPGVVSMLRVLHRQGAVLAAATGNLEAIGRMKLDRCALLRYFPAGAFSDRFESREEIFRHGVAMMHAAVGTHANVCAIGDTPADIRAARACGIDVIAVASGVYSREELAREAPNLCLSSMKDLFAPTADAGCGIAQQLARTA